MMHWCCMRAVYSSRSQYQEKQHAPSTGINKIHLAHRRMPALRGIKLCSVEIIQIGVMKNALSNIQYNSVHIFCYRGRTSPRSGIPDSTCGTSTRR